MRRIQVNDFVTLRAIYGSKATRMQVPIMKVLVPEQRFEVLLPRGLVKVTVLEIEWGWIHLFGASLRKARTWSDSWLWGFSSGLVLGVSKFTSHPTAVYVLGLSAAVLTLVATYLVE